MDRSWARQRPLQLRPTKCLRSASLVGTEATICGKVRRLSTSKGSAANGAKGKQSVSQDLGVVSSSFAGRSAGLTEALTSLEKDRTCQRAQAGRVSASYGIPWKGQRRQSCVVTRARTQPMPQGTYVKNAPFRKSKRVPSNQEYLEDEGWGTEDGPEAYVEGEEIEGFAEVESEEEGDNGVNVGRPSRLQRQMSLDSLADEEESSREGSQVDPESRIPQRPRKTYTELQVDGMSEQSAAAPYQQQTFVLPERPRRVLREINAEGKLKDEAEEEHRRRMEAAGVTSKGAFGFKAPVIQPLIAKELDVAEQEAKGRDVVDKVAEDIQLEEEEEYQGKRLVVERVPGARRKAAEEDVLPPKAQTKEEFDR
jgi:hypothetical protein